MNFPDTTAHESKREGTFNALPSNIQVNLQNFPQFSFTVLLSWFETRDRIYEIPREYITSGH